MNDLPRSPGREKNCGWLAGGSRVLMPEWKIN